MELCSVIAPARLLQSWRSGATKPGATLTAVPLSGSHHSPLRLYRFSTCVCPLPTQDWFCIRPSQVILGAMWLIIGLC